MVATTSPLLEVEGLNVTFEGGRAPLRAVRDVSFSLGRERLGIVGESGSGKSTTGRALLGLLPHSAKIEARRMSFEGTELTRLTVSQWRELRGRRMSMILQDPKFSLNPVIKVGEQIMETLRLHEKVTNAEARRKALAMLEAVRIRDPESVFDLHPHQLSGGMGQRVMIAAMLIAEPDLLIADEPTSALDVTVQNQVLRILDDLVRARGMGLIFISHNLTAIASFCDRVLVMYGGRIMEELPARDLGRASHPYTRALIASAPDLDRPRDELAVVVRDPSWTQ
jgi:peptide/nickel transport system ATP-binding protein